MSFKLWSELNPEALKQLKPTFGIRSWNHLNLSEKQTIWKHLQHKYFFTENNERYNEVYYEFDSDFFDNGMIMEIIDELNTLYKAKSYGINFLEFRTEDSACLDFLSLFMKEDEYVVIEMLSLTAKQLIRKDNKNKIIWKYFDEFLNDLNELFSHFGLNLCLTRAGFIPKQEDRIMIEVYEPVLQIFSNPKWKEVNQHLSDAFSEYRKNSEPSFSNCVTNTVTAVQAFLQIIVNGKTGSGDISKLVLQAQKLKLIPDDSFSKDIFKNIESILMRERQDTGIAHPKKEYATEKSARLVLNVSMVFFQHCIV